MFYHFKIKKESNGYWAECLELEGCNAEADTMAEVETNMQDALNLYLSEPFNSKVIFPLPFEKTPKMKGKLVKVSVDSSVAFSFLMRITRLQHHLTLSEMAKKLQYKNINTYAKLERPKTSNPELKTIAKITRVFNNFPIGLVFA